jgi:hypothetical protein
MDTPDVKELRRQLYELEETHRWAHHVADLNSGQVLTFLLERPITPLSRAERLSRLGRVIDPSIFRGPLYTLTPRTPYQASPMAWLTAFGPVEYLPYWDQTGGRIWWWQPQEPDNVPVARQINFNFTVPPVGLSLVSLSVLGDAYPGVEGHVLVSVFSPDVPPQHFQFPIADDSGAAHTIDLVFTPEAGQQTGIVMVPQPGIRFLSFASISFFPLPPPALQ